MAQSTMDWTILDRISEQWQQAQADLRSRTGRILTLVGAILALVQFAIIDAQVYQHDPRRFLGFVVWAGSVYWVFGPVLGILEVRRMNTHRDGAPLLKHLVTKHVAAIDYGPLLVSCIGTAAATVMSPPTTLLWATLLLMLATDVASILWISYGKAKTALAVTLPLRMLGAANLVRIGSGLDLHSVTHYEKIMALWPILAIFFAGQFVFWHLDNVFRLRPFINALGALRNNFLEETVSPQEAETRYIRILRQSAKDEMHSYGATPQDSA